MPNAVQLGPNHFCLDQADENVKLVAKNIPWYGPKYSPHDVPSFYDISGVVENPAVFKLVIDLFVERYKAAGDAGLGFKR